ncbi:MAG TPA: hypothetical protein EYN66_24625, partial [Myxococcales bacterium]|nr:hypothetical protein [Myxococcales bacterium]
MKNTALAARCALLLFFVWACDGGGAALPGAANNDLTEPEGLPDIPQIDHGVSDIPEEEEPLIVWDTPDCETTPDADGCPCTSTSDCVSQQCVLSSSGLQCAHSCLSECPAGWSCESVLVSGGDLVFVCIERAPLLCRPCTNNQDCALPGFEGLDQCISYGDAGHFCGISCSLSLLCPSGYTCSKGQCISESGICECSPLHVALEAETGCQLTNGLGSCKGLRKCTPTGLSGCDAAVAQPELCDGVDNDCDELVDEEVEKSCSIDNVIGSCTGHWVCKDGVGSCEGSEAAPEICDGVDNDCDGINDEGFPDQDDDGLADCVDPDIDNDGFLNEMDNCPMQANPEQTDTDLDEQGDLCDADDDNDGSPDSLDCKPLSKYIYPMAPELCDGVDNDCDMVTDEGSCTDDNLCTDDICDPKAGCFYIFNEATCSDGNPCTGNDHCVAGACAGKFFDCDDKNPCTDDSCQPQTGCQNLPNTLKCSDGNPCT